MSTSSHQSSNRPCTAFEATFPSLGAPDDSDPDSLIQWTEEDIVQLHWRLLLELRRLADPETPLEEKLDTLAWAPTDPELDGQPFSLANSVRVVGTRANPA